LENGNQENLILTERLTLREMDGSADSEFVYRLLNSPKFIRFIGDRGVRSVSEAADFIESRYRRSYRENGYGLYTVERRSDAVAVGICGFVRRPSLPGPDIGFALFPEYEGLGYGFEAASATLDFGRDTLGFTTVFAITTTDNIVSGKLLNKLGFLEDGTTSTDNGETLRVYRKDL
jgi:RimJ/RimL family protein N-acetyltransferase